MSKPSSSFNSRHQIERLHPSTSHRKPRSPASSKLSISTESYLPAPLHTTLLPANFLNSSSPKSHAFFQMPCSVSTSLSNAVDCHSSSFHLSFLTPRWVSYYRRNYPQCVSLPWCFLSFMILVVAGPSTSKFVTFMAKIEAMGAKTL